jgi:predicted O-methyltransferase YrrM
MSPHFLDSLEVIADFLSWQHHFRDIEGFLHDLEGYILMQLAAKGGGIGAIVEVGSFMGRSTAFLAAGTKLAGREKVFAVDHFRGSLEHQSGGSCASQTLAQIGTTFPRFQHNLQRVGLLDHVVPVQRSSIDAAEVWQGPVRLLFIDGDHEYESVRADFLAWSRFVVPHGVICFHDFSNFPGVARFYQELMQNQAAYAEVATVVSMKVIEKL